MKPQEGLEKASDPELSNRVDIAVLQTKIQYIEKNVEELEIFREDASGKIKTIWPLWGFVGAIGLAAVVRSILSP